MGANFIEENDMGAHVRALEYCTQVIQSQLDVAKHRVTIASQDQCLLQDHFDELITYLIFRSGW